MVRQEEEIRGADRIGKDLAEIERLFARMKEERRHKKGRRPYNNRRSTNRSGPKKKEYNRR